MLWTIRATSLAEEAKQLPPADRIELIERLLSSLDKPDLGIDRVWAEESERRLDAYLSGDAPTRDAEDVLVKHLKR
jgi:putative addiction module component (TIGR02574 family)